MRDHSRHIAVNRFQAMDIILKNSHFEPETEVVPTAEAVGRVLAEDVCSLWNNPNCLTCRMDSVAVHFDDFAQGMPDTSGWTRGVEWEFANTGVAMPAGFDTAIVVEHVQFSENDTRIAFDAAPSERFAGTIAEGSRMQKGDLLVPANTEITPLLAAHIESGNHEEVRVYKKPRVAFIPTGNELVPAGGEVPAGKNIESNSVMIAAKIRRWGGEPVIFDVVRDKYDLLKEALLKAADMADIVVLNAGSSKGNDDWGIEALDEVGTIFYHETNHGPGHHSSFALIGEVPVVGISGPPGGAGFTCDFYLYPVIRAFLKQDPYLKKIKVRFGADAAGGKKGTSFKQFNASLKGESRPKETGEFYSIRQVKLKLAEDGVVEAYLIKGSHPGPLEADAGDAYYHMLTMDGVPLPEKGDFIEVELRP